MLRGDAFVGLLSAKRVSSIEEALSLMRQLRPSQALKEPRYEVPDAALCNVPDAAAINVP